MIGESNKINNFCLYSDDKNHRYLLSRILLSDEENRKA